MGSHPAGLLAEQLDASGELTQRLAGRTRDHVIAQLSKAVDQVSRAERAPADELARTRYLWLKRPENLTARQAEQLAWLTRPSSQLATARAWRWRMDFDGFYDQPAELAEAYLTR